MVGAQRPQKARIQISIKNESKEVSLAGRVDHEYRRGLPDKLCGELSCLANVWVSHYRTTESEALYRLRFN